MAHSQSQSDIESTTQVVATGDDTCPVCGATARTQVADDLAPVCADCGVVLREQVIATLTGLVNDGQTQDDDTDWAEVACVRNATQQQVADAFGVIEATADRLDLNQTLREHAADTYCDAYRAGVTDGRQTAAVVVAATRQASLQCEFPVPTRRLADTVDATQRQCRQAHTALCEALFTHTQAPTPTEYIPFLAHDLCLSPSVRDQAVTVLTAHADTPDLVGKHPAGVAAAALYLASTESTQAAVATAAGVSTETVRKRATQLDTLQSDA